MEFTKNNSSQSQISYNLERNIVKSYTLTAKQTEKEHTAEALSTTHHLIMSIFSFLYFVASIKLLVSIRA